MRITAVSKDRGRESECFNASTPPPSEPDLRRKGGLGADLRFAELNLTSRVQSKK
jgi:hypothetical protein